VVFVGVGIAVSGDTQHLRLVGRKPICPYIWIRCLPHWCRDHGHWYAADESFSLQPAAHLDDCTDPPLYAPLYWLADAWFDVLGVEYSFGHHAYTSTGVFEIEPRTATNCRFRYGSATERETRRWVVVAKHCKY
jgi:hypothetical protein